jgi:hypothetical protein
VKSFSNECILETLLCDENVGIDYIEVGYEFPNCITSSKIKTVVMVDAKNIRPVSKLTNCVRVASYPNQIHTAIEAVENFKSQGFEVFLHLMTADKFEDYQLLKNWKHKDILTSIYFADTFGAFMPKDVENIYKKLQDCGFEQISFHAHNNLQLELLLRYLDKDNQEYIELIKKYYLDNPCVYSYKNMISGLKNLHPSQAIV